MIGEAILIGFKEAFKIGIVWLVLYSYLLLKDKKTLIKPFYLGVLFVFLISVVSFFLPQGVIIKEYLSNFISMSFAIFLISSGVTLFHASGIKLFEPFQGLVRSIIALDAIVFMLTVLLFSPDSIGSVLFIKELFFMKGAKLMIYISAFTGLFIAVVILLIVVKFFKPYRIGGFFDLPQLLLFFAMVKLFGGGIKGISEISLIPSVQRGFMKFMHDVVHQVFVLLMVPDHPLLKTTVWNFIGIFFGSNIASVASLFILLFLPLIFIYYSLFTPLPEPEVQTGSQRRKIMSIILSDRRKKALPVIAFICIIVTSWFSQSGETVSRLYNPKPKPVVEDKGIVLIPLNDPTMDLMDGALHKFSLAYKAEEIKIVIIKKSGNALAVCLDACDICPPEGYGQRDENVVCIYCNTPIPINTLGEPGGCNPIPLTAIIDERFVRIELSEILKKWEYVKTGKSKETIK